MKKVLLVLLFIVNKSYNYIEAKFLYMYSLPVVRKGLMIIEP